MTAAATNADPGEVARFNALASRWWDPSGEMRLLHRMNPVRMAYITGRAPVADRRVLDVGCGGGILTEALARAGAVVTGIDLAEESLRVARLHQFESALQGLTYRRAAAEELADESPESFDIVTCLEMLEHVPDPPSVVAACRHLVRPGGHVFFSTINRNPRAYALTVLAAEYLLGLVPRGTHDFSRFIRPSELDRWARQAGLALEDVTGLVFDPASGSFRAGTDVRVNYIVHFRRPPP